ncbi:MAG: adenylyl-sulfate kinase [Patescibacteria group bacterium]|nr:adenylyl-sulfate kinase [Patescibacteria group bacterium]MDD5554630.1 adenylyl-sulfate kinase [Patescibacteria group bacterium]
MDNFDYQKNRELLRLATAGSVDDGKSTLIGRLFYDCNAIYEDQLLGMKKVSKKKGFKEIDLSLLTDGLAAEREQGITIDVAYRYFNTSKRRIIIADVPGHEQYTRNMITGASEADVVLILVDASIGLTNQSKRHLFLASLLGASHIIVVINKMDAVNYSQKVFEKIKNDFINYATKLNIKDLEFIPVSALKGDMVVNRGENMPWYGGDTVLYYLENTPFTDRNLINFRLPVQMVIKFGERLRGYAGKIESGVIKEGEEIMVLPSEKKTKIKSIIVSGHKVKYAFSPQSIIVRLTDEIDVSRGDMIVRGNNRPEISSELEVMLCCLTNEPLRQGKSYLIKQTTKTSRVAINSINYRLNINTLHRERVDRLELNEIGRAFLKSNDQFLFDVFIKNRNMGSFILIDEITKNTVGAGIILNKGQKKAKNEKKKNFTKRGAVLWFTGLSGSGKSTIADEVREKLEKRNIDCERLDGDIVRQSLTKDLGFSRQDRDSNISRVSYVANLLSKHGVLVLATFISPYRKQREMVRKQVSDFIEIFVDAPLEVCQRRDTKGLYKKAGQNEVKDFTGITDPYEEPKKPDIHLRTDKIPLDECVNKILAYLENKKLI